MELSDRVSIMGETVDHQTGQQLGVEKRRFLRKPDAVFREPPDLGDGCGIHEKGKVVLFRIDPCDCFGDVHFIGHVLLILRLLGVDSRMERNTRKCS